MTCRTQEAGTTPAAEGLAALAEDLKEHRRQLDRQEGDAVLTLLGLASLVAQLRGQAEGAWTARAVSLGLTPASARALARVGGSGLPAAVEADEALRLRLPNDVNKLSWLSRLDDDALRELLGQLDAKQAPHGALIRAVKAKLGTPPRKGRPARPEAAVAAACTRLGRVVAGALGRHAADQGACARVRDALAEGLSRISDLLRAEDVRPR
jgi:hypothetical protein